MEIDKQQILELIKSKGGQEQADKAHAELPDKVDTDKHSDLLGKFGVDPSELAGGIGGKLGF